MNKIIISGSMAVLLAVGGCGKALPQTSPQSAITANSAAAQSAATNKDNSSLTNGGTASPAAQGEKPVQPETNPVGDIPDSQAFVSYSSDVGGYSLKAPEGWARMIEGAGVSYIDKYDGVKVSVEQAAEAPTVASIKSNQAAALVKNGRAVKITDVAAVKLPGGDAVRVTYESNSDPNAVTNKQIRQENESYYYYKNGHLAVLTLWAPLGADNVDQWKLMAESFRWK